VQRTNQGRRRSERATHAAIPYVLETLGQPFFDERLRRQNDPVTFQLDFQIVARHKSQLIVNPLRNDHLPADTDFYSRCGAARFGLCFHIFVFYGFRQGCQGTLILRQREEALEELAKTMATLVRLRKLLQEQESYEPMAFAYSAKDPYDGDGSP